MLHLFLNTHPRMNVTQILLVRFFFSLFFFSSLPFPSFAQESKMNYRWEQQFYGKIQGEEKLLYTHSFQRSQMAFGDIDGDGDEDLLVGKADGSIAFFENIGQFNKPNFRLRTEFYQAWVREVDQTEKILRVQQMIDVGNHAVPALVDIDQDRDLDLFIGSQDGNIFFYENKGNHLLPILELITPNYMSIRPGENSVIRFEDVNSDRALDLLVGTREGKVFLYHNAGVPTNAKFCTNMQPTDDCPFSPILIGEIFPEINASPAWVDWNHDQKWDIVIGKGGGKMDLYINQGTRFEGKWKRLTEYFLFLDAGGTIAPVFQDFDQDGFPELLIGKATSKISFYQNREVLQTRLQKINGLSTEGIKWTDPPLEILSKVCERLGGEPLCFPILAEALTIPNSVEPSLEGYTAYVLLPFDSNTVTNPNQEQQEQENPPIENLPANQVNAISPQLQVNAEVPPNEQANDLPLEDTTQQESEPEIALAQKTFATRISTRNDLWLRTDNFLNFEHLSQSYQYATVTSGDWNGDGKEDLLIGSDIGQIFGYENRGSTENPDWYPISSEAFAPNQRLHSAPALVDLDEDGDLDVLVGRKNGRLELLLNTGKPNAPQWEIKDLFYAQIDVGSYSSPTLYDIDNDQDFDLFIGNQKGRIIYYENQGTPKTPNFILRSTRFSGVTVPQHAKPAFFLRKQDASLHLVIGDSQGELKRLQKSVNPQLSPTQGWSVQEETWYPFQNSRFSDPHFMQLDQDAELDLLLGDQEGNLLFWLNRGVNTVEETNRQQARQEKNTLQQEENSINPTSSSETMPLTTIEDLQEIEDTTQPVNLSFDPVYTLIDRKYTGLDFGKRAVPAFADLDGDGDTDLVVGTKAGNLWYFLNEGDQQVAQWKLQDKNFLNYEKGKDTTPTFIDLDQDGDFDLIIGNEKGSLDYWENTGSSYLPEFTKNDSLFVGVTGGRKSRPVFLPSPDGQQVWLLVGNFRGTLFQYQPITLPEGTRYQLQHRKYLDVDVGFSASPVIADINNDRIPELMIGSDQGQIWGYKKVEITSANAWGWEKIDDLFSNLELPLGAFPAFADIDGDGDTDMIVGSEEGRLYLFRNDGEPIQ